MSPGDPFTKKNIILFMSAENKSPIDIVTKEISTLKRGSTSDLEGYLRLIYNEEIVNETTHLYVKFVKIGSNKLPRTKDLCEWLQNSVTEYVHSREVIAEAKRKDSERNVSEHINELKQRAVEKFTTSKTSGEFGEILIYTLLERFLQLPQIVTKMSLKTNAEVHFHGADGIHLDSKNKKITLIISESKMKQHLGDGITECIKSIETILSGKDKKKGDILSNEIYLVRNHLNIDSGELEEAMRSILEKKSKEYAELELKAAGLVCFDYDTYKNKTEEVLAKEIEGKIQDWKSSYLDRLRRHRKKNFEFIFFLLPIPSVDKIREEFKKSLGI